MALLIVVAACVAPRFRHPLPATRPVDFNVYYSASLLVRQGHASALYDGADTGTDPQKAIAAEGTPIYQAARSQGLSFVGLYVYPPLLADLLVPLTAVKLQTVTPLWLVINVGFLLATALLLIRLLGTPLLSAGALLLAVPLLCFTPALQCLVDGQITIFLLLLWAAGMVLYKEEHVAAAGIVFALATAIKLTPALVLLPFLIWRTWRFVGAYLATLLALALLCLWVDSPHTFANYFTHVMPAMSGAIPYYTNYSLAAATERLITVFRTGQVSPFPQTLAASTVLTGRLASTGMLLVLLALIARAGRATSRPDRLVVLGLLSLAAAILSPVSWFHAYAMSFIAFAMLWHEVLQFRVGTVYLLALTAVSLLLGSALSENALSFLVFSGQHAMLASGLQFGQLALALAVIFFRVWKMRIQSADLVPVNP